MTAARAVAFEKGIMMLPPQVQLRLNSASVSPGSQLATMERVRVKVVTVGGRVTRALGHTVMVWDSKPEALGRALEGSRSSTLQQSAALAAPGEE